MKRYCLASPALSRPRTRMRASCLEKRLARVENHTPIDPEAVPAADGRPGVTYGVVRMW